MVSLVRYIYTQSSAEALSVYVLVTQSCLTLCDPMDCSLPGSSVRGLSQARILQWVAIPFSGGSSQLRIGIGDNESELIYINTDMYTHNAQYIILQEEV